MFYIYNYLSISLFFLFFFLNNPPPPKSSPFPHPAPLPTNRELLGHQDEGPLQGARLWPRRALLGQRGIVEALHQRQPPRRVEPHKPLAVRGPGGRIDRKSTRLNSSHSQISYAVFCLKKKKI